MGKLLKTLIYDQEISLSLLETTDIVNDAIKFHNLSAVASAGLGRALTITAFMASSLKNQNDRLSITISGDGPGGHIITSANADLSVRGCIDNPMVELPLKTNGKLDVGKLVGSGYITVVKNMGLKEPYVGRCNLVSGEIAEDFTAYYAYSEQQPTAISLGVLIGGDGSCIGAGGLVLQPLPNCKEENICKAENLINSFSDISRMINKMGIDGIKNEYFSDYEFIEYNPKYRCNCSKEYIDSVLITLGTKELYDSIEKDGKVEICCHFCDKKYVYNKQDIDKLFAK